MVALINPYTKKPVNVPEKSVDRFLAVGFSKPVKRGRPRKEKPDETKTDE